MGATCEVTCQPLLETFCREAPLGAVCVYRRGWLVKDRNVEFFKLAGSDRLRLDALANYAQEQGKCGILMLLQRRTGENVWEYLAVRTGRTMMAVTKSNQP